MRVREGLGQRGLLYVGDCEMAALETRAFLQAGGDDDLCPLSESPLPPVVLADDLAPVWTGAQAVTVIQRPQPGGSPELIAEGFERQEPVTAEVAGQPYLGLARRLSVSTHTSVPARCGARRRRCAVVGSASRPAPCRRCAKDATGGAPWCSHALGRERSCEWPG